jgi:TatD DNase family protein
MQMIDTHTHLYLEQFDEDREAVVDRAKARDVNTFLLPNIDVSSIGPLKEMVDNYPNVKGMMGLHPCSVNKDFEAQLRVIETELRSGDYIAVGEMGIDLYWDKTFLKEQQEAFTIQVEWAKELNLPVVLHVRDAFTEVFELLDKLNDDKLRGVFHCFTGGEEEVKKIDAYGNFYYGIGGVVTFKKAGLDKILPLIPEEKLILETDSPYLAPTPHRGKRNESAYTAIVGQKVADVLERPLDAIAELTTANARRMFAL